MSVNNDKTLDPKKNERIKAKGELLAAKYFIELLNLDYIILNGFLNPPEPDFELTNTNNKSEIGLELVSLNNDSSKISEKHFQDILDDSCRKFKEEISVNTSINVQVSFNDKLVEQLSSITNKTKTRELKKTIVEDLFSIVYQFEKLDIENDYSEFFNYEDFSSEYIERVSVTKVNIGGCSWSYSGGCISPPVQNVFKLSDQIDLISICVDKKIDKPKNYKQKYSELWLLIYTNEGAASSLFTLDGFDYNKCYKTTYDKVYLMLEDKLVLLNTIK